MAYTASEVRNTCHANNMHVSRYDGEWRITPNEVQGTSKGERIAYYTDDNEDAICTAIAMRRHIADMRDKAIKIADTHHYPAIR